MEYTACQRTSDDMPNVWIQRFKGNTPDSCMIDCLGKKQAYLPSSGLAWRDSMDISIESTLQRRINAHVDKPERPWNTSSFDVRGGPHTERKYCNVLILIEATYLCSWAENRLWMTRTGSRIWKQCEPQYGLQSPRADSTPLNRVDQQRLILPHSNPNLTPTNYLVPETVDALQLPRIGC